MSKRWPNIFLPIDPDLVQNHSPHNLHYKVITFKSQVTATSIENLVDENTVTMIPKLPFGVFKM